MWKVILCSGFSVLFLTLFQGSVLSGLFFLPAVPDLVMLFVLYISFKNSSLVGSTCGFLSGLILDALSAAPIGLNAFTKSITGYILGRMSGMFNLNKVLIPSLMAFSSTLFKAFLVWVLSLFFGPKIQTYLLFGKLLYAELLVNALFAPIVFGLLHAFQSLFVIQD